MIAAKNRSALDLVGDYLCALVERSANRDHRPGSPVGPGRPPAPPPHAPWPETGGPPGCPGRGVGWNPLPLLPLDPDDELPPFRFWFGPVGNGPCVLPLPV